MPTGAYASAHGYAFRDIWDMNHSSSAPCGGQVSTCVTHGTVGSWEARQLCVQPRVILVTPGCVSPVHPDAILTTRTE